MTHFEVARASCPCEVMAKMAMPPQTKSPLLVARQWHFLPDRQLNSASSYLSAAFELFVVDQRIDHGYKNPNQHRAKAQPWPGSRQGKDETG